MPRREGRVGHQKQHVRGYSGGCLGKGENMSKHQESLEKIKPGDVILTCRKNFDLMSLPIKIGNYFKKGPKNYKDRVWTHAAVYVGNGQIVEAFPQGIVKRELDAAYFNEDFGLNILRHKNASEEAINKAINFYVNEPGAKYDFWALIYFVIENLVPPQLSFLVDNDYFGDRFNVKDSYFCSELVSEGFKRAGIYCFEREPYKIMPIEFDNELLFDSIYKAYLPRKENKTLYSIKAFLFNIFYIAAAILFLCAIFLIALIIVAAFVLLIGGFAAASNKIKEKASNQ